MVSHLGEIKVSNSVCLHYVWMGKQWVKLQCILIGQRIAVSPKSTDWWNDKSNNVNGDGEATTFEVSPCMYLRDSKTQNWLLPGSALMILQQFDFHALSGSINKPLRMQNELFSMRLCLKLRKSLVFYEMFRQKKNSTTKLITDTVLCLIQLDHSTSFQNRF